MKNIEETPLEKTIKEIRDIRILLKKKSLLNMLITQMWGLDDVYSNYKFQERLTSISNDFKMMKKYWMEGVVDNQRSTMFMKMVDNLDHLLCDMEMERMKCNLPFFKDCRRRIATSGVDFTLSEVKAKLEAFVSDFAMTELLPEKSKELKLKEIHTKHQKYLDLMFDYILSIGDMSKIDTEGWTDILVSPTIDAADRQMLIAALVINMQNVPQTTKMRCLLDIYKRAEDDYSRQPALVGWALSLHFGNFVIDDQIHNELSEIFNSVNHIADLTSLQLQIFIAMNAEKDSRTMDMEINKMRMTSEYQKIADTLDGKDVDHSLDDVLNASENNAQMDEWVETLEKLSDMRKKGADLFFSGFAQLKNMGFFLKPSNWFVNFYLDHPDIDFPLNTPPNMKAFLKLFTSLPMLPTDKYSFVMMSLKMAKRLPSELLMKAFDDFPDISEMPKVEMEDIQSMAIRDAFTKSLYRFYQLFAHRECFNSPMKIVGNKKMPYLFFASYYCKDTLLTSDLLSMCKTMYKMGRKEEIFQVCDMWKNICFDDPKASDGFDYLYFLGAYCYEMVGSDLEQIYDTCDLLEMSIQSLELAHQLKPNMEAVTKRLLSAYYLDGQFDEVFQLAQGLLEKYPDDEDLIAKCAESTYFIKDYEQSEKLFYKLIYLYPDNEYAMSCMPNLLIKLHKNEQAEKIVKGWIDKGLDKDNSILYKHMGILSYMSGNYADSVEWYAKYYSSDNIDDFFDEEENYHNQLFYFIHSDISMFVGPKHIDEASVNIFTSCISDRIDEIKLQKKISEERSK